MILKWYFFAVFSCLALLAVAQPDSSNQSVYIERIELKGNDKTKDYIILRELTFQQGDTLLKKELFEHLTRSKKNIFNTRLFNFVDVAGIATHDSVFTVVIDLQERWYLWPKPLLENADRNFNTWWQDKDLSRLSYGMFVRKFNVRGRNETLQLNFQWGFERQLSATYSMPFIDSNKKNGLNLRAGYSTFREVNYASEGNKRSFISSSSGEPLQQLFYAGADFVRRGGLYFRHTAGVTYHQVKVKDSLQLNADEFLLNNNSKMEYLSFNYNFRFDKRNNIVYPLTGQLVDVNLRYRNGGMFSTSAGFELLEASTVINQHSQLKERLYAGGSIRAKTTLAGTPPYFVQRGFGYDTFIRGYELYVMDAQDFIAFKSHLKYALVPTRKGDLPLLKDDKFKKFFYAFYLNLNFDIGYANDELYASENPLSNNLLMGYGAGLDFVSYYDIVIRAEYSRNLENEGGIFLHFKKAF